MQSVTDPGPKGQHPTPTCLWGSCWSLRNAALGYCLLLSGQVRAPRVKCGTLYKHRGHGVFQPSQLMSHPPDPAADARLRKGPGAHLGCASSSSSDPPLIPEIQGPTGTDPDFGEGVTPARPRSLETPSRWIPSSVQPVCPSCLDGDASPLGLHVALPLKSCTSAWLGHPPRSPLRVALPQPLVLKGAQVILPIFCNCCVR